MDGKSLGWNNEEEDKRGRLALYMLDGKGLKNRFMGNDDSRGSGSLGDGGERFLL